MLGTAPTPSRDPVAVAIRKGKQNNMASASTASCPGLRQSALQTLPATHSSAEYLTAQVSDIISAEHSQHSYLPALQSL